jgi:hypothetical protein
MKKELIVRNSINIHASANKVWDILTNPTWTKTYMCGFQVLSQWKKGGEIIFKGVEEDGGEIVVGRGVILNNFPVQLLEFSLFEPHLGLADRFENETVVTYHIHRIGINDTILSVQQGDFSLGENGQQRFDIARQRWNCIMPKIKAMAEKEITESIELTTPSFIEHSDTDVSYNSLF